jgi:hypothetical protein
MALEAALNDMKGKFAADFNAGNVGSGYNTFAHRSRIFRQMEAAKENLRNRAVAS